jgi:pyruvate dehydrogenase E1 component alpha subunit
LSPLYWTEAVVAGAMTVLRPEDAMITAYRDHAHALAKGISANAVMAELYGKVTGCSKGKGGSMHMFSKSTLFWRSWNCRRTNSAGCRIAFAEKYRGTDNVCVCYMGDGAVRQGAFHEALNMAMYWKLPVILSLKIIITPWVHR